MYWNDIASHISQKFKAEGARIVSAGFRGDRRFIRRLKTIIRLADAAVVDDIGTNIGFCKYMGKPVYFEGGKNAAQNDVMYNANYQLFRKAFISNDGFFSEQQISDQNALYDSFWGGEREILSREQVRKLFDSLTEIYDLAGYHIDTSVFFTYYIISDFINQFYYNKIIACFLFTERSICLITDSRLITVPSL